MIDRIIADPEILGGKPIVQGTRLSMEFILELLASWRSWRGYSRRWQMKISRQRCSHVSETYLMCWMQKRNCG